MAPICTTASFASGAACVLPSGVRAGSGDTGCVSTSRDPPRGKATYANLCADPAAEVWGVLYKITRRDLVRLEATEGVPWWRYRPLWLDAEDMSGTALHAATLTAEGDEDDYTPTLRYLTLLREGARAHGLPDHYIRFLEQVEHGR